MSIPVIPLAGGLLIGLSSILLLLTLGRIAGISGIVWGALSDPDRSWRWQFVSGLVAGAFAIHALTGRPIPAPSDAPLFMAVIAGILVGIGTRVGSGCTSGHGVCGIGRRSVRSIIATCTFMATGVVTVALLRAGGLIS
jgi:uncharacterized membrane protein YedE/YeeE